jgi:hypothetical protein
MSFRKYHLLLLSGLAALLVAAIVLLWPSAEAQAQCGSQASSCKNCHEVQAQDPVNNDGTSWHVSHAFGDFCYLCHAGNNQSMDKDTAHTGMVPPLSDIKAGCQSCHPNDLQERAQVYASVLGITLESGGGAASAGGSSSPSAGGDTSSSSEQTASEASAPTEGESQPAAGESAAPGMVAETNEVVDYNQRYEENALGKRSINWGNVILVVLIVLLLLGGGAFVYYNERKRRGLSLGKAKVSPTLAAANVIPLVEGYSTEVTALLPKIAQLNPAGLHALKRLLENPDSANELLQNISKLDPELVTRVRALDRSSRELLLAMSGD